MANTPGQEAANDTAHNNRQQRSQHPAHLTPPAADVHWLPPAAVRARVRQAGPDAQRGRRAGPGAVARAHPRRHLHHPGRWSRACFGTHALLGTCECSGSTLSSGRPCPHYSVLHTCSCPVLGPPDHVPEVHYQSGPQFRLHSYIHRCKTGVQDRCVVRPCTGLQNVSFPPSAPCMHVPQAAWGAHSRRRRAYVGLQHISFQGSSCMHARAQAAWAARSRRSWALWR